MYAIHFGFLFQNLNVTFFFLSSHMYDKKKKLQHIFQLFQDKKKKNAMILFNLFFLGLYPHFIIFQRSGVEAREFRNIANNLLLRLMIVVEDTVKELGITKEELREVQRKRSYITACYFQAVTCY